MGVHGKGGISILGHLMAGFHGSMPGMMRIVVATRDSWTWGLTDVPVQVELLIRPIRRLSEVCHFL